MANGDIKEPYGSTGVPRRIIGITYLGVALILIVLDGLDVHELTDHDGIIVLVTTGLVLLGIGVIKDIKFFNPTKK